jgi:hypothetical protein
MKIKVIQLKRTKNRETGIIGQIFAKVTDEVAQWLTKIREMWKIDKIMQRFKNG